MVFYVLSNSWIQVGYKYTEFVAAQEDIQVAQFRRADVRRGLCERSSLMLFQAESVFPGHFKS